MVFLRKPCICVYRFWQWKSPKCNQAQEAVSEKCKKRGSFVATPAVFYTHTRFVSFCLPFFSFSLQLVCSRVSVCVCVLVVCFFWVSVSFEEWLFNVCASLIRTESVDLCSKIRTHLCVYISIYWKSIAFPRANQTSLFVSLLSFLVRNRKSTNWNGPKWIQLINISRFFKHRI